MSTVTTNASIEAVAAPSSTLKTWLPIVLFSLLWVDLVRLLSGNWEAREQYAYGWFVPFLALALLWRRWFDRPSPQPGAFSFLPLGVASLWCALMLPLRAIFEINTDWPLVALIYTLIAITLTLYAFCLAGGWVWGWHFAFPVCFILVALVWPYRIEKALTQNLMQLVATLTVEIIGWFGVPAIQRGNLIEVTTGVVGVDEACSGIRSFQSTLMAALFLGELYRLRWPLRLVLLVGGVIASFCLNVVRTLFLTWQASAHGVSAIEKWHDSAGMIIFLLSFACLWGIAALIWRRSFASVPSPAGVRPHDAFTQPQYAASRRLLLACGGWTVLCVLATEIWYRSHESGSAGLFHWTVSEPAEGSGVTKIELPERTQKIIKSDVDCAWGWRDEQGLQWTVYFFRWNPTSIASVTLARVHRPERCLPAAGLRQVADDGLVHFEAAGFQLPFRQYTYEAEGQTFHVFFCQWEDGSQQQTGLAASNQEGRLRSVLTGRRKLGQQTLEVIVTGPVTLREAAEKVREKLPQLIKVEKQAQPDLADHSPSQRKP